MKKDQEKAFGKEAHMDLRLTTKAVSQLVMAMSMSPTPSVIITMPQNIPCFFYDSAPLII